MSLPDPLSFCASALEAGGALVEQSGEVASALLTPEQARLLRLPEALELGAGEERVPVGLGSPLLEALIEQERRRQPLSRARLELPPTPEGSARSLAAAWTPRNGVAGPPSLAVAELSYLWVAAQWTFEADERSEGLVFALLEAASGARPSIPAQLDLELLRPLPSPAASVEREGLRPLLRRALQLEAAQAVGAAVARTRGRCAREHHRVADYYGQLIQDAQRPRRKVDPATLQARVEHLRAERDSRLADLAHRYGMRMELRPAALLHVQVRAVTVTLRVKRRKGEREQRLTLWPGARAFDQLPCAGCERWIGGPPLLCDDQLHALCEVCAPSDAGRPDCPACRAPR